MRFKVQMASEDLAFCEASIVNRRSRPLRDESYLPHQAGKEWLRKGGTQANSGSPSNISAGRNRTVPKKYESGCSSWCYRAYICTVNVSRTQ